MSLLTRNDSSPATPAASSTGLSAATPVALSDAGDIAVHDTSLDDGDEQAGLPVNERGEPLDAAAAQAAHIVSTFLGDYAAKDREQTDAQWLTVQFRKYPELWSDEAEIESAAREVSVSVAETFGRRASLNDALANGQSRAGWFASELERVAATKGVHDVGAYANTVENALEQATRNSATVIRRADGAISGCLNLDGFIAEQHHVDTFNVDAVTRGSPYRAKVMAPAPGERYGKNSVDIVICDGDGKIMRRYQSKYGADADVTSDLFAKGDYRGQRKLVPEGHGDAVSRSTETIEMDGVSSKPLSKEQAKQQQHDAQENGESAFYDWERVNRRAVARQILKGALLAAVVAVGFEGARILGRRTWNTLQGKTNPTIAEDLKAFLLGSLGSAANAGFHTAFAGAMVIAVKRGLLGELLKQTAPGRIASAAFIALENVKVLWQLGQGRITAEEALDTIGETTTVAIISLAVMTEGAALGAAVGAVFGPVGVAIGGFTGGLVAGMAGGVVGKAIYAGSKTLGKKAVQVVSRVADSITEGASRMVDSMLSLFGI
ncbi:hypothetical protein AB3X91_07625 [Paraburkholderia sp. BR14263]|uniref:hypothetical protein n=1 Tax=unclassified Paraburkholderia TaxID=2615204 RepID=UPI0034CD5D9D